MGTVNKIQIQDCRSEVINFAIFMEQKLKENNYKLGWEDCSAEYLLDCLWNVYSELEYELDFIELNKIKIRQKCVDIANFALMLADNFGNLNEL